MQPPKLRPMTIRTLRKYLQARCFAVPKLQRNFVWDPSRAAKLLDSIYQEMPIGSIFLWEMDRKSANLIRQSADVLPPFNSSNREIWFVIDGQQRLSVIHQAFEAQVRENDAGREIDFGRLCFVVSPPRSQNAHPRVVYRKPLDRQFVPIRDILAIDWRKRMPSKAQWFLRRIGECRRRLLSYPVSTVLVRRATLQEIGEIFIRVNSQGMRITSSDRAVALMGNLDVRAMAEELRAKVREDVFALLGIDSILMGFNLVTEPFDSNGDPPKLDLMARRWSTRIQENATDRKQFEKIWQQYQNAFRTAVDYLHTKYPVYNESYLPSANMLATLSVFFFHHRGQPNGYQANEIRKWFWATGIAQRYSGRGYHHNIAADAKLFAALAAGKRSRFQFRDLLDPVSDIQGTEYTSRSARARTLFCLLATLGPRYIENAELIPLAQRAISHTNRRERHHIFPQAQMKNFFSARIYNSLCNICFLVSLENAKIGTQLPRKYLAAARKSGGPKFLQVMRSHLIPAGETDGIWKRGVKKAFKEFRHQRLALICDKLEEKAGIELFARE